MLFKVEALTKIIFALYSIVLLVSASNTVTPVARFLSLSYLISVTIEKGLKVKLPVAIAAGKVEDWVLK